MVPSRGPRGRTPPRLEPVPKPDGGVRLLARLDPADERDYSAAVARLVPGIELALGPEVLANRTLGRGLVRTARLEPWRPARAAFHRRVRRLLAGPGIAVLADVRACFPSIGAAALEGILGPHSARVALLLRRLGDAGIPGLPVGPDASAILANAVLALADSAVLGAGCRHLRWVDDFVVATDSPAEARRALSAIAAALAPVGLDLSEAKTGVFGDRREALSRLLDARRPSLAARTALP